MSRYSSKCSGKSIKLYGNVITSFPDAVQFSVSKCKQNGSQNEVKYKTNADVPFQLKNISLNFSGYLVLKTIFIQQSNLIIKIRFYSY